MTAVKIELDNAITIMSKSWFGTIPFASYLTRENSISACRTMSDRVMLLMAEYTKTLAKAESVPQDQVDIAIQAGKAAYEEKLRQCKEKYEEELVAVKEESANEIACLTSEQAQLSFSKNFLLTNAT